MKALVTGGGGFLGGVIVRMLKERGDCVRSLARNRYDKLDDLRVEQIEASIEDYPELLDAVDGCDVVYHVAAKAGIWGSFREYYTINVIGTRNLISACREKGVKHLVYTSSPSVVFDGSDMEGVDESTPYPKQFKAPYPETKAMAEQLILEANGDDLKTVSLRPHLIWGPEDNHLVPRIISKGKAGQLRRIGNKPCLVDTIYVDNAAEAHLQAADELMNGGKVAGKSYFISQDEPIPLWDMVNKILETADAPPVTRTVSEGAANFAGSLLEGVYRALHIPSEPRMTRFLASELSTAHWFDISAAKNDFGYTPSVSTEEGLERLRKWVEESDL